MSGILWEKYKNINQSFPWQWLKMKKSKAKITEDTVYIK